MKVIGRQEARAAGLTHYFTGKPCKHGHISKRYVSTTNCEDCKKSWASQNREKMNFYSTRWAANNPEKFKEQNQKWYRQNPQKNAAKNARRRALTLGAQGGYSSEDVARILQDQRYMCPNCKSSLRKGYHIDHIMPLALGGGNDARNIQCLCPRCNLSKGARHPIEWARREGRLI